MKPEAQRIAIAEACGFRNVHWYEDTAGPAMLVGDPPPTRPHRLGRPDRHIPDYLTDLNAMHEAEKLLILPLMQREGAYRNMLHAVGCRELIEKITATAAQRAEAFLRTLNLWTD